MSADITTKVVGTTKYDLPSIEEFYGNLEQNNDTWELFGAAVLQKEPDNPYDPYAVQVLAYKNTENGTPEPMLIGYLGKSSEAYKLVNEHPKNVRLAHLHITEYDNPNLNSSYSLTFKL